MNVTNALVIGAGIAGTVAAMALQRAGIRPELYESHVATDDRVGAALNLAPNGIATLDAIDASHVIDRVGTPTSAIVLRASTGKQLGKISMPRNMPPMRFVWRADLYEALYSEARRRGIPVIHGKRLCAFRETRDRVIAHFDDGTEAEGDILIGADGIRSTARRQIDPLAAPRPLGLWNFGGRTTVTVAESNDEMHMIYGKRGFFGYQTLADGSCGWFANVPPRELACLGGSEVTRRSLWKRTLENVFAEDRSAATEIISSTELDELCPIGPIEELTTVSAWSRGRAVLCGDAAHAMSPSSGQGASLAIESAVLLARLLRDAPYDVAFRTYEQRRRPRVERIRAAGARSNNTKVAGPIARTIRDLAMPLVLRALDASGVLSRQFDYRVEW